MRTGDQPYGKTNYRESVRLILRGEAAWQSLCKKTARHIRVVRVALFISLLDDDSNSVFFVKAPRTRNPRVELPNRAPE